MIVIRQKLIYRQDLHLNPTLLYIFGDNLSRTGLGGQAKEMRGEPNSFGIATKRLPLHGFYECYFHDSDSDCLQIVDREFDRLYKELKNYKAVVIPSDGIGTGLSKLNETAPRLLDHINYKLLEIRLNYHETY